MHAIAVARAEGWRLRLDRDQMTDDQKRQFLQWLNESPALVSEMLDMNDLTLRLVRGRLRSELANASKREEQNTSEPLAQAVSGDSSMSAQPSAEKAAASVAISSSYLTYFQRRNRPAKLALGGLSLLSVAISLLGFAATLPATFVAIGLLAAVLLKERIVSYRIKHGLFGNTSSEIRTLIRFVVDHADSIDFTDGHGKRRPVFERAAPSTEQVTSPTGAIAE